MSAGVLSDALDLLQGLRVIEQEAVPTAGRRALIVKRLITADDDTIEGQTYDPETHEATA